MAEQLRIVGIGASAGGIAALRGLFQHMPKPDDLAFVVVLHLSPDRASMLAEVLRQWTDMPVSQATDGAAVTAGAVYVIPPNMLMTIEAGRLRLRRATTTVRESKPIDVFFTSLAADQNSAAVGVVLSGTGNDGSLGLKAIRQSGGLTLAQGGDGDGPQYSGMPGSAIAAGAVDLILPAEAMAERILNLPAAPELEPEEAEAPVDTRLLDLVPEICQILSDRVGHDFSGYKQATFLRRVRRRMQFLGMSAPSYVRRLQADPSEVLLLFQDLLIRVTGFFRDSETYPALETDIIPRLFEGKAPDAAVRVWVAGCATGEEAYSIAMLLSEHRARLTDPPKIQVLASDIDEMAINVARSGRYPAFLVKDIAPERLAQFFTSLDGTYQVRKDLRDICTFSMHSIIRDPPFSRIDLISCRNLLIYLDTALQDRVIPAFHYALQPNGYLLLGSSEMVSRHHELFTLIDKPHRIFQRGNTRSPSLPVSPSAIARRHLGGTMPRAAEPVIGWSSIAQAAKDRVLERHAPPFVVVDARGADYLMRILPYRAADDQVDGALLTFIDVTSVVRAEQQQRIMVDELNHRVRNMLTVVISIATQTIRQSRTLEEFAEAFIGRVDAMASTYTLLSRENWTSVPLRDVLGDELRPFASPTVPRFVLEGEPVLVPPRAALAFGMIIHELVTNAVKYGALSVPDGTVTLRWHVERQDGNDQLICCWTERGGPAVARPARTGFGLGLVERSTRYELRGEAIADWQTAGLSVTLKAPLNAVASATPPAQGEPDATT